jgi:hypothetical protein
VIARSIAGSGTPPSYPSCSGIIVRSVISALFRILSPVSAPVSQNRVASVFDDQRWGLLSVPDHSWIENTAMALTAGQRREARRSNGRQYQGLKPPVDNLRSSMDALRLGERVQGCALPDAAAVATQAGDDSWNDSCKPDVSSGLHGSSRESGMRLVRGHSPAAPASPNEPGAAAPTSPNEPGAAAPTSPNEPRTEVKCPAGTGEGEGSWVGASGYARCASAAGRMAVRTARLTPPAFGGSLRPSGSRPDREGIGAEFELPCLPSICDDFNNNAFWRDQ